MIIDDIFSQASLKWQKIISEPDFWFDSFAGLDNSGVQSQDLLNLEKTSTQKEGKIFVAGGAIVRLLGDNQENLWKKIQEHAENGKVVIAGIEFDLDGLALMGEFYRWLKFSVGLDDVCVDERLDEYKHNNSGVHEHCGAGAAIGVLIGESGISIENEAVAVFGYVFKQPLLENDQQHHFSPAIYIDFSDKNRAIKPSRRQELIKSHALPFNVSYPVAKISEFLKENFELESEITINSSFLLETLFKWNIQIPQKIIYGDHNKYQAVAEKLGIIVILDKRGVFGEDNKIISMVEEKLKKIGQVEKYFIE